MATVAVQKPVQVSPWGAGPQTGVIALVGNPNTGKTTVFNALTGLRAKTANYPGTTVEKRVGTVKLGGARGVGQALDLPGLYSLDAVTIEEKIAAAVLGGTMQDQERPSVVVLILDAANLERNLYLASQVLEIDLPTVVALNMTDVAKRQGIQVDTVELGRRLGCPVVATVARSGKGLDRLREEIAKLLETEESPTALENPHHVELPTPGCVAEARYQWAAEICTGCLSGSGVHADGGHGARPGRTERIDRWLTHPTVGVVAFLGVMFAVFAMIFWIAQYPMEWIDGLFSSAGSLAAQVLPEGPVKSLLVEGVIGGVGGMVIFLPQITILFFFLSLLEDTGYLARAAFVMDRLMRPVGLPGKAFVPLLSSHACAIPGIMATRVIEDRRDRLVTILVAPLMTCSARIPVYAMVTALLFPNQPVRAALLFTGAYSLGIVAALGMSFVFKHTILRGQSKPLMLELPSYRLPSVKNALIAAYDRATVFLKRAGTVILAISVILWWMANYPQSDPPAQAVVWTQQAEALEAAGQADEAQALLDRADQAATQHALANSFVGRLGRTIEPAIEPLGFDWQIGIGVLSSFAAREVIVSTLAVVFGVGADAADENPDSLYTRLTEASRSDGTPVFTTATCVSLLVFYVLAMQCLPTQAVTRRETNSWRWPVFQFVYMTVLAYGAAWVAYQVCGWLGIA